MFLGRLVYAFRIGGSFGYCSSNHFTPTTRRPVEDEDIGLTVCVASH
jgi:hypothetical protein